MRAARRTSTGLSVACTLWLSGWAALVAPRPAVAEDGGGGVRPMGVAAVAALSEAADRETADGSPVCVAVIYVVQAGREQEAAEDLRRLAAVTRKEPGNLLYAVHRSLDDPRQFLVYEQYRTLADLEAHRKTPYFQRYSVEGLQKIAESRTAGTFTPF